MCIRDRGGYRIYWDENWQCVDAWPTDDARTEDSSQPEEDTQPDVYKRQLTGRMGHHRGVRFYRCKEMAVHVDRPLPVHVDGESCFCQTDIHLRCVEKKLRMIV